MAVLCSLATFAQDATLQGKVTDALTGEALIGVSVVYAPGKGTATDLDGVYRLSIPAGEQRVMFSFLGYASRTEVVAITAGEPRTLDLNLATAAAQLDMIVVTAGKFEQRVNPTMLNQIETPDEADLIELRDLIEEHGRRT